LRTESTEHPRELGMSCSYLQKGGTYGQTQERRETETDGDGPSHTPSRCQYGAILCIRS
jgi:hypothetical protein